MSRRLSRFLASLLLLALACAAGFAQSDAPAASGQESRDPRVLYEQGLEAYRALEYTRARSLWTRALEVADEHSAAQRAQLCNSLGNVAFRQELPLEAAAWFRAATLLVPRDETAWHNLELARSKAGLEPEDRGDLKSAYERAVHALTQAEAAWLALAAAVLFAALCCLRFLVVGPALDRWLAVAALLAALLAVPWAVHLRERGGDPLFVVSTAGAGVLSEPRAGASKLALLSPGSRAERLESVAGWTRVRTETGERGWVDDDAVFPLAR